MVEYAAWWGYKIDKPKSTRHSIAMRKDREDKVIISKRAGHWIYFSVYDDRDSGTIIDFAQSRTGKALGEVGQELSYWLNGSIDYSKQIVQIAPLKEKQSEPKRVKRLFNSCTPITKHAYLAERGIGEEVLKSPHFKGRVFKDRFENAVFPHFKDGEVSCLELRSENTKLIVRGSVKTFWRSNFKRDDHTLIISESPIDAISYDLLYRPKSAFYIATSGGMSTLQSDLLIALLEQCHSITSIIIITDNDKGGNRLAGKLEQLITDSRYQGQITRHNPPTSGQDWNEVLKIQMNI